MIRVNTRVQLVQHIRLVGTSGVGCRAAGHTTGRATGVTGSRARSGRAAGVTGSRARSGRAAGVTGSRARSGRAAGVTTGTSASASTGDASAGSPAPDMRVQLLAGDGGMMTVNEPFRGSAEGRDTILADASCSRRSGGASRTTAEAMGMGTVMSAGSTGGPSQPRGSCSTTMVYSSSQPLQPRPPGIDAKTNLDQNRREDQPCWQGYCCGGHKCLP